MTEKTITYDDLQIDINDIYEQMTTPIEQADDRLKAEVNEMLADIRTWLKPKMSFTVVPEIDFDYGKIIERQLRGSVAYALFVCTAGVEYQEFMERLTKEGDMMRLFIANATGSVLAERCADYMETILQGTIDKLGWHRTNRFSPGYCGWHVREQQRLFPLMKGHHTGVTLTPSSLMIPIKSVSGIIGLGPDVRYLAYTCGLCDYKDCYKRKKRTAQ